MQKLPEVESAKALMTEARTWSVMKWLREKKNVRKAADQANAALDKVNRDIKAIWIEEARTAYEAESDRAKQQAGPIDSEIRLAVRKVKQADDEAYRARMDAENTFDEAERQLSTSMAREGCQKAILSWELHEKAIRKAEALARPGKALS